MSKKKQQRHLDYWKNRQEDILRWLDQAELDVSAELAKVYNEQSIALQKDLYAFYAKYAEDNKMTYRDAVQKLRHEDLSDYRVNANRYREQAEKDPELLKRLNEQYASAKATRMDVLSMDLAFRVGMLKGTLSGIFENHLKKVANYAYRKSMGGLIGTINEPALKQLVQTPFNGYNYSQQLWGNTDNLANDLKEVLKKGFVRGDGPAELARELAKKYDVARHRAETLIRTDGTMIVNKATAQRYKDAGLLYYRDLVQMDSRTTVICREIAYKNERKRIDEMKIGVTAPPYHFNCRTTIVPDDDEIGLSAISPIDYRRISYGDKSDFGRYVNNGLLSISAKKVSGVEYQNLYISDKILHRKLPARYHDKQIIEAMSLISEKYDISKLTKPKVIIVSRNESNRTVLAGYNRTENILYVRGDIKTDDQMVTAQTVGQTGGLVAENNPLATVIHELGHWYQYQDAKRRFPTFDDKIIKEVLRQESRSLVDDLLSKGYNINKDISKYAGNNIFVNPEEVFAEKFVKDILF